MGPFLNLKSTTAQIIIKTSKLGGARGSAPEQGAGKKEDFLSNQPTETTKLIRKQLHQGVRPYKGGGKGDM